MMKRTYIYAGSFDPPTLGHLDIIRQAMAMCDYLIIAVGRHSSKTALFSGDEKKTMLHELVAANLKKDTLKSDVACNIDVISFDGLVVEAARAQGANVMIRGLRDGSDFDYEMQMALMNAKLAPGIQTIFLPASSQFRHITATLVRQIAAMGGDVSQFVPDIVANKLALKFSPR